MPIGMLVTLDAIFNRVIQNWRKGKTTWVFADEFYLLFRYQYSADFSTSFGSEFENITAW